MFSCIEFLTCGAFSVAVLCAVAVIDTTSLSMAVIAICTAVSGVLTYLNSQKLAKQGVKLEKAEVVQEKIHKLTNSSMAAALKATVVALKSDRISKRRLADDHKQDGDIAALHEADAAVTAAEEQLAAHEAQQAKVDAETEKSDNAKLALTVPKTP